MTLKSFEKSQKEKVLNEVKILSVLSHKNIIKFHNWYETRNHFWSIYEYLAGGDLKKIINQDKILNEPIIRLIGYMLVDGLSYMHSKGVIFCDLRPGNVCFDEYNNLNFVDFGLAKLCKEIEEGLRIGDFLYNAPELFCKKKMGVKSDIWSLGIVLYELATGKVPFFSDDENGFKKTVMKDSVKRIEGYSEDFNDLVFGILKKNPDERFGWNDIMKHSWFGGAEFKNFIDFCDTQSVNSKSPVKYLGSLTSQNDKKKIRKSNTISAKSSGYYKKTKNISQSKIKKFNPEISEIRKTKSTIIDKSSLNSSLSDSEKNKNDKISIIEDEKKKISDSESLSYGEDLTDNEEPNLNNFQSYIEKPENELNKFLLTIKKNYLRTNLDNNISPIIFNNEIEIIKLENPVQNFQKVILLKDTQLENIEKKRSYISLLFRFLSSNEKLQYKIIVINHMTKLMSVENFANLIINSLVFDLFIKQLRSKKSKSLKIALCTLIGSTLRYTTRIDLDLKELDFSNIFLGLLNNNNEIVKRRALAAFGEFLFFSATQADEKDNKWEINEKSIFSIFKILKICRDLTSVIYAAKIIENITGMSEKYGKKISNEENLKIILQVLKNTKSYVLASYLFSCLFNFLKLNTNLKNILQEKVYFDIILSSFKINTKKLALNSLNLINFLLLDITEKGKNTLFYHVEKKGYFQKIVNLLSESENLNKSKALLNIIIISSKSSRGLHYLMESSKILPIIDKIFSQEKNLKNNKTNIYLSNCLKLFTNFIKILINKFLDSSITILKNSQNQKKTKELDNLNGYINYLNIITSTDYLINNLLSEEDIKKFFLMTLFLDVILEIDDLVSIYLNSLENILKNPKIVKSYQKIFLNKILPELVNLVKNENKEETRFVKFKVFIDVFNISFNEDELDEEQNKISLLIFYFCNEILKKNDLQLSFYALKLIRVLIEKNLVDIKKIDLKNLLINIIETLQKNLKEILNPNFFALIFYILANDSTLIFEIHNYGFLKISYDYLNEYGSCEQLEEIFGFLNLYFEILHKLIKSNQLEEKIEIDPGIIKNLLDYLFFKIRDFKESQVEDVLNIIYYSFFSVFNGRNKKNLVLSKNEVDIFSIDLKYLSEFYKKLCGNKASLKKLNKIEKAFKNKN